MSTAISNIDVKQKNPYFHSLKEWHMILKYVYDIKVEKLLERRKGTNITGAKGQESIMRDK